jgi:hypothetical protein
MKDLTKTIFGRVGTCAAAIIIIISPSLKAEAAALPDRLSARAMLVRIGADEFEPIGYDRQDSATFSNPMDIAMSILGSGDSEPVQIAEIQMFSNKGDSISGETKSSQAVQTGIRKLATNSKEQRSYYLTEYIDLRETCNFKLKIFQNTPGSFPANADEDKLLNCWYSFSCGIDKYLPYEELDEQTTEKKISIPGDRIRQFDLEVSSVLAMGAGQTAVVSTQRIADDYWVLLLHISDCGRTE